MIQVIGRLNGEIVVGDDEYKNKSIYPCSELEFAKRMAGYLKELHPEWEFEIKEVVANEVNFNECTTAVVG